MHIDIPYPALGASAAIRVTYWHPGSPAVLGGHPDSAEEAIGPEIECVIVGAAEYTAEDERAAEDYAIRWMEGREK